MGKVLHGDCNELLSTIPDGVVDMVLCDLPYGTTNCAWDTPIDLPTLWAHYDRIVKPNGAILLFAQTPFDKVLGVSNLKDLRYEWIWEKTTATGHLNAEYNPMKAHENILVFYKKRPTFNPQKTYGHVRKVSSAENRARCIERRNEKESYLYNKELPDQVGGYDSTERFPRSIITFRSDKQKLALHETQKPVELLKYFIRTYSNEGDLILDNTAGSGSLAIACLEENRDFIVIEKEKHHIKTIHKRIEDYYSHGHQESFFK